MEDNTKIRFATAQFVNGEVKRDSISWATDTLELAMSYAHSIKDGCGLFFYGDIKDTIGGTYYEPEMNATREQFEQDPVFYGVCYYRQPYSNGKYIFE